MKAPHGALMVVWVALLAVQGCAEKVEQEVFNLDDLGEGEQVGLLQANDTAVVAPNSTSVNDTMANRTFAKTNATSLNASKWNPQPLKKPFHHHMKANRDQWTKLGGWNKKHEAALMAAKQKFHNAKQDVVASMDERDIREMGCPCPGEKYYELVHDSTGPIAASPNMSGVNQTEVAEMLNSTNTNGTESESEKAKRMKKKLAAMRSASSLVKRMTKKYGTPGPQSSWTKSHDGKLRRAKVALHKAKKEEDVAFKIALPEFKKMKEEQPELFTNGDCQCPETWTKADAATLATKEAEDVEAEYQKGMKAHKKNLDEMSGESERKEKKLQEQMRQDIANDPAEEKHQKKMATPAPSGAQTAAPGSEKKH